MVSGNRWVALLVFFCAVAPAFDASAQKPPAHRRRVAPVLVAVSDPQPPPEPAFLPPPPARPNAQLAPRIETVRERRWGLLSSGLVVFAAGWALDIGVSYGLNHPGAELSLIPLVGPLVQMGDTWGTVPAMKSGNPQIDVPANQRIDEVNHAIQTGAYVVLAVDFALQLAGIGMVTAGAVGHRVQRTYALDGRGVVVRF
jgi:hypothetical protein